MTEIDEPIDSPNRILWDNDSVRHIYGESANLLPMIEDTGTVVEVYSSDYYDVTIKLDKDPAGLESRDSYAFVEADLELIDG